MHFYILVALQIMFESFPISSSGHCLLLEKFGVEGLLCDPLKRYFYFILHVPTIIIVCIYFYKEWSFPFKQFKKCWRLILKISLYTMLADTMTLLCYGIKDTYAIYMPPLAIGFLITGCSLYTLRWCPINTYRTWSIYSAFILGCVQAIAFIPGVSRFGLTYVVARWFSITPRRSFQIAFLIEWPLLVLASSYSFYLFGWLSYELLSPLLILVMLGASICAYIGLMWIGLLVTWHLMWLWSVYMIIPLMISLFLEL